MTTPNLGAETKRKAGPVPPLLGHGVPPFLDLHLPILPYPSNSIHIPFSKLSVFHCVKFVSHDVYSLNPLDEIVVDSIHIDPVHVDNYRKIVPGRFNTAVIQVKDSSSELDLKGTVFTVLLW